MGYVVRSGSDAQYDAWLMMKERTTGLAAIPSYYILECFTPLDVDPADIAVLPEVDGVESWMSGAFISAPVPEPLELELSPDEPGPLKEMYNLEMLIMSERLVEGLLSAGVDNLQVFRAVIVDPFTKTRRHDYRVVNVVGRVSAADMQKSLWTGSKLRPLIDVDFDSLVIDQKQAAGLLLFRLAECVSAIVVHARVRDVLVAAGFIALTFLSPRDYVG